MTCRRASRDSDRGWRLKAAKTRAYNLKHAGTAKHTGTRKHTATATKGRATAARSRATRVALSPKAAKARALSLDGVSCCPARAVAASARLAGVAVSGADVLALYRHTADGADAGASIWATLEAAYRWGLAGVRPRSFTRVYEPGDWSAVILGLELPEGPHAALADGFWLGLPDAVIEECWQVVWP
jgi:hypothetical protein